MNVELLIHGVPEGQDFYGIKEEHGYTDLFYDKSTESVKFVVEIKKQGNNVYCYYSYLRYEGMVGAGGRPGAYFGLTLRMDLYYQDTSYIYNLLDMLFKRYIVGDFLVPSSDGYKYTIKSFADKSAEIDKMLSVFLQLMQSTLVYSKLLKIDASFVHPVSSVPKGNIADVSEAAVLSSIKKYSKIELSPDYEMNIVKEFRKKIQEAESKGANFVAEKESVIVSLKTTISTKDNEITALKQEVKNKDVEIRQNKQKSDLERSVSNIKEPITALADYFRVKESKTPVSKYGDRNFILGLSNGSLLLVVFIICLISFFRTSNGSTDDIKGLKEQIVTLNGTIKSLESDIEAKKKTISDLESQIQPKTPAEASAPSTPVTLRIDVKDYSSGKISPDKTYIVSIKNGKNNYDGKGEWVLTNAEIKSGKKTDPQITIQPNGKGQVKLDYKPADENCKVNNPRSFEVSVPTQSDDARVSKNTSNYVGTTGITVCINPNVKEVKIGKRYELTVNYEGQGSWHGFDGFKLDTGEDKRSKKIKVVVCPPSNKLDNEVVVSYLPDGINEEDRIRFRWPIKNE